MSGMNWSGTRREWLRRVGGGLAGAGVAHTAGAQPASGTRRPSGATPPAGIVVMVSDGMSLGVPSLAEDFSRQVHGTGTEWWRLASDRSVTSGWFDMRSLTSLVTDSAAAASAWGSGSRVRNGAVNVLPDGTRLTPLAVLARDAGRRIGLVTTTTVTHATPAGFAATSRDRNAEDDIASQYLGRVDVLMGGGRRFFEPGTRGDGRDLVAAWRAAGYPVWTRRADVRVAAGQQQALGLFAQDHLPFAIDRLASEPLSAEVPTLGEMTSAALAMLAGHPHGFFLVVEGGRVDHAAHANDAAATLHDQIEFDEAVARVRTFAEPRGDVLVVVTTDHGNANPGLNGVGTSYRDSSASFARIASARASFAALRAAVVDQTPPGGPVPADAVRGLVLDRLGVEVTPEEAAVVAASVAARVPGILNRQLSAFDGVVGQVLSNYWGIGWTGTTHTADLCPVMAFGPGREHFAGLQSGTALFDGVMTLMGIRFRNPSVTPAAAQHAAPAAR